MNGTFLQIKDLDVAYGNNQVLKNINLEVGSGEIVAIIGPNGSGKTTLLKALLNLVSFRGELKLEGKPIQEQLKLVSYMPQTEDIDLNFPITVKEAISLARYNKTARFQMPLDKKSQAAIQNSMELLQITSLAKSSLGELSGGQRQRTLLARTLAQEGSLILLDEPTNEIDFPSEQIIITALQSLQKANNTILITTHDLTLAKKIATKILLLNHEIIAYGIPEKTYTKQNLVKTFGEHIILEAEEANFGINQQHTH
jgi:iron/zinc/copper transport system ATP-binding protein